MIHHIQDVLEFSWTISVDSYYNRNVDIGTNQNHSNNKNMNNNNNNNFDRDIG